MLSQKSCSVSEVLSYFSKLKECMDVENKKEREFIEKTEFITAIQIRDLNRINEMYAFGKTADFNHYYHGWRG